MTVAMFKSVAEAEISPFVCRSPEETSTNFVEGRDVKCIKIFLHKAVDLPPMDLNGIKFSREE